VLFLANLMVHLQIFGVCMLYELSPADLGKNELADKMLMDRDGRLRNQMISDLKQKKYEAKRLLDSGKAQVSAEVLLKAMDAMDAAIEIIEHAWDDVFA